MTDCDYNFNSHQLQNWQDTDKILTENWKNIANVNPETVVLTCQNTVTFEVDGYTNCNPEWLANITFCHSGLQLQ